MSEKSALSEGEKLTLLKQDLQMLTNSNDDFLLMLLNMSDAFVKREGIQDDGGIEYCGIQIQYAAYLFRKRAGTETSMPRFLRWEMNNLLFSQKSKAGDSG